MVMPQKIKVSKTGIAAILVGFAAIFMLVMWHQVFTTVNANEIVVVQAPFSGKLTFHISAGLKMTNFGKVTRYVKRDQFWFSEKKDQGKADDDAILVRFNDGGHAKISGSISWEMPLDEEHLTMLHQKYGSHTAIEQQLIRTVIEKSVYMTGPLMSSKESYAERRNDLLQYIEDQINNGIYKTATIEVTQPDPMTGEKRTVNLVTIVKEGGKAIRTDDSPLNIFGLKTLNPSINNIVYDDVVEKQIQTQQQAIMQVQTAIARAKQSEQAAITATKDGEAHAAEAKWQQEVIKAKEVTQAEQQLAVARMNAQQEFDVAQKLGQQKLEVAKLDAQSAAQYKAAETLRGEGEAARRRAVMSADGALEQKLKTYKEVSLAYAEAIKGYQGDWVPKVVIGGGEGKGGGNGASQLVDLLTAKTAHELGLSMPATERNVAPHKEK